MIASKMIQSVSQMQMKSRRRSSITMIMSFVSLAMNYLRILGSAVTIRTKMMKVSNTWMAYRLIFRGLGMMEGTQKSCLFLVCFINTYSIYRLQLIELHMKRISEELSHLTAFVKEHPIALGSIVMAGVLVALLRKYHYKFVVYPQIGGRHNNQNPRGSRHPQQKRLQSEDIEVQTEGNLKLRGWYIKHQKPQRLIVYFHQNAGSKSSFIQDIGGRLFFLNSLLERSNSNVLLIAYRGFSDSDGNYKPNESQIMKDAIAIFKKALQLGERDKLPIFVFGRSLGGAAAIHVLSRPQFKYSAKGLILQNTFTSIYDVAQKMVPSFLYPLKYILWLITSNSYRSIAKIKDVHVPLLFIRGAKDELVPAKLMQELEQECLKSKNEHFSYEVKEGTHNDTWYVGGAQYFNTINEFMTHCSRI